MWRPYPAYLLLGFVVLGHCLGLWKYAGLSPGQAAQNSLQLLLSLSVPCTLFVFLFTGVAADEFPSLEVRLQDSWFVCWIAVAGTCVSLAWLVWIQMVARHMLAQIHGDPGARVRRRTLVLAFCFPLQAT